MSRNHGCEDGDVPACRLSAIFSNLITFVGSRKVP